MATLMDPASTTTIMITDILTPTPTTRRKATPVTKPRALLQTKVAVLLRFYPRLCFAVQQLLRSPTANPANSDTAEMHPHEAATIIDLVGVDMRVSLVSMT